VKWKRWEGRGNRMKKWKTKQDEEQEVAEF
jgi:hypothetical protein